MSCFVEDLIPVILNSNDHWWDRDLVRLALVSPGWLHYVRRKLYSSPALHSFSACASLARTLGANPNLAPLVQMLTLRPTCTGASRGSSKERISVRSLLSLEGLRGLVLGGELAIQAERFLGFITAADTLTHLHIDGAMLRTSLTSRASLEWSDDLIFRFPNLKTLKLTDLEVDISPVLVPSPLEMDELVLENVNIISGFLSHLIPEGSTLGRLYVTASSGCEYDEHIRMVLYSSSVHTLEYEVQKASPSDGSFLEPVGMPSPRALLQLRRLELHGLHVDNGVLVSVGRWCPEIEELVVSGRLVCLTAEDWKTYLTSGALSSLRRLMLTWGTNHPPYQPWCANAVELLTQATSLRRIELIPV